MFEYGNTAGSQSRNKCGELVITWQSIKECSIPHMIIWATAGSRSNTPLYLII